MVWLPAPDEGCIEAATVVFGVFTDGTPGLIIPGDRIDPDVAPVMTMALGIAIPATVGSSGILSVRALNSTRSQRPNWRIHRAP